MISKLLYFNRQERKGIIVLVIILCFSLGCKVYFLINPSGPDPFSPMEINWEKINNPQEVPDDKRLTKDRFNKKKQRKDAVVHHSEDKEKDSKILFAFDPNLISEDSLKKLPLSKYVIDNILKFRSKGGKFYKKEDLQKIYGLSLDDYDFIESFIVIKSSFKSRSYQKDNSTKQFININLANEEDLMSLYGIGPVLAKRIVKFREKLGGFIHKNQIKEVYGLPDSTFQNISGKLLVSGGIIKIKINEINKQELMSHPYFNRSTANMIINYRNQHGVYRSAEDLKKLREITRNDLDRFLPYIDFQ